MKKRKKEKAKNDKNRRTAQQEAYILIALNKLSYIHETAPQTLNVRKVAYDIWCPPTGYKNERSYYQAVREAWIKLIMQGLSCPTAYNIYPYAP